MIVKFINKSSREIPEEFKDYYFSEGRFDKAQDILREYNLKVIEYEREFNERGTVMLDSITIGDA